MAQTTELEEVESLVEIDGVLGATYANDHVEPEWYMLALREISEEEANEVGFTVQRRKSLGRAIIHLLDSR